MNYDNIAEMVNKLVKDPKGVMSQEQEPSSLELTKSEFNIIQNVFSKYEVSGNTLSIEIKPLVAWE